jgi:hypothetical protein
MGLALLGLLVGGGLLGRQELTRHRLFRRTKEAGHAFVDALDARAAQAGLEQPGGLQAISMPEPQREALRALVDAGDTKGAISLANSLTTQRFNAIQQQQNEAYRRDALDLQQQQFGFAKDQFALTERQHDLAIERFDRDGDLDFLARKGAATRGEQIVADPNSGAFVYRPAAGTKRNDDIRNAALSIGQGLESWNLLMADVSQNGVIRDPSAPGFGRQQSLTTQLIGAIKDSQKLGALDEGVITFATGLTGDQLNARDYFLGNDATSIERLSATGKLFADAYGRERENLRLLPGVEQSLRASFDASGQRYSGIQQWTPALLDLARQNGGDLPSAQPQQPEDEALLSRAREGASVIGGQIDQLISGLLGFAGGRLMR